ncbi:hypothetical protein U3A58_18850 [Algoriphagus sp. C2-6-M1]|nr:hypothetical protein [Algoriphagus sp. C2-6-M1]MEB2782456.1 hypothetical protein [Algoriphagus sp. C2-6-M1]
MKNEQKLGFSDYLVQKRKIKQEFFSQVHFWIGADNVGRISVE